MVIADPHVLPDALIEADPDFDSYMQQQRKMLHLSEPVWHALMETALTYKPELLLIPGDLTRDGEAESHAMVAASLQQLREAGIQTLVIPGNHDLPDKVAWESLYMSAYPDRAQDPNSYSYALEPLPGVTVLGIDGSHGKASTGSLSDATLNWLVAQADEAHDKGNVIIAMSHWQVLEHFDWQAQLESSCRFSYAKSIRDSLMRHHVRVLLTGHFHVNGVTTYVDTLGIRTDSLVEITTGSPITYPCPYRWLTLSEDRNSIAVQTDRLTSLPQIPDLYTYSRDWMAEHAAVMIPKVALRVWRMIDEGVEYLRNSTIVTGDIIASLLDRSFPKTDEERVDIIERHFGSTAVALYLLHSDGNEYLHPEADSLAQAMYIGIGNIIHEMTDGTMVPNGYKQHLVIEMARETAREPIQSLVEDITDWRSFFFQNRTDDLHPTLYIRGEKPTESVESLPACPVSDDRMYDLLGRPVSDPVSPGVYIRNGQKIQVL